MRSPKQLILVTSWKRLLVQKLIVAQMTVKFSDFQKTPSLHTTVKEPTNFPFLYPYGIGLHPHTVFTKDVLYSREGHNKIFHHKKLKHFELNKLHKTLKKIYLQIPEVGLFLSKINGL